MTPELAAQEAARRLRARDSLIDFSQSVVIPGAPVSDDPDEWMFKPIETSVAHHHRVLMAAVQECIETEFGRLMVFMPPGSAKSTYVSVVALAWFLGKYPNKRAIMTSYAATPAHRQAKRARQLIRSPEFASIWPAPVGLLQGSDAVNDFALTNGSGLISDGLMGGLTSNRADLGIIDDPVAGREEADSPTIRKKTRAAYDDDFLTRLKPNASAILIQTRWHLDDLAGSILPEDYDGRSGKVMCRDGMEWMVLNIPAKCERTDDPLGREIGEYLWPEWFTPRHWAIYERNPRTWAALFQQRPTLGKGGKYTEEMFHRYSVLPEEVSKNGCAYGASDWAVTELSMATDPDFSEHAVAWIAPDGDLWIEGGWSGQEKPDKTLDAMFTLSRTHGATEWLTEAGVIRRAVEPMLDRKMREDDYYIAMTYLTMPGDKIAKNTSFHSRASAGKVHVKHGAWGDALIAQLCDFPFGRYDDKVDVTSLFGAAIDMMNAPPRDEPVKKRKVRPGTTDYIRALAEEDDEAEARRKEYFE